METKRTMSSFSCQICLNNDNFTEAAAANEPYYDIKHGINIIIVTQFDFSMENGHALRANTEITVPPTPRARRSIRISIYWLITDQCSHRQNNIPLTESQLDQLLKPKHSRTETLPHHV